ncbi:unnamed protein product, partial [Mesorhabditis spiculigera]
MSLSSSFGAMLEEVRRRALELGLWNDDMQRDLPKKWEKHGNMIVFPQTAFQHNNWRLIGRELWEIVARALSIERLGRKRLIANDEERTPHVDVLYGGHGWIEHSDESGFRFVYDASKKVFEIWRQKEMARISQTDAHGEVVVNLMAGLGYFTFPWAAKSGAKHVHAVEWDDDAVEALIRTTTANGLDDKVSIHHGEARKMAPVGIADRVYIALLPSSQPFWMTACKCLRDKGGWLHIQEAVDVKRERAEKPEAAKPAASEEKPEKTKTDVNGNTKKGNRTRSKLILSFRKAAKLSKVEKELEEGRWKMMEPHVRGFALDLAEKCCRYMNNIKTQDGIYWVEVRNVVVIKPRTASRTSDIIVVDLFTGIAQEKRRRSQHRLGTPSTVVEDEDGQVEGQNDEERAPRRRRNWEEEILKQIEEEDRIAAQETEKHPK